MKNILNKNYLLNAVKFLFELSGAFADKNTFKVLICG